MAALCTHRSSSDTSRSRLQDEIRTRRRPAPQTEEESVAGTRMRGRSPPRAAEPRPPRAPRPRPRPPRLSGRAERAREEGGWAWRLGPTSAASHWARVRGRPPAALPLDRACERRAPLGRADLGTKFKDFKSTSWRLLEDKSSEKLAARSLSVAAAPSPEVDPFLAPGMSRRPCSCSLRPLSGSCRCSYGAPTAAGRPCPSDGG